MAAILTYLLTFIYYYYDKISLIKYRNQTGILVDIFILKLFFNQKKWR